MRPSSRVLLTFRDIGIGIDEMPRPHIFVPRVDAVHDTPSLRAHSVSHGIETVLIVEDKEAVRHQATRILLSVDHAVMTAASADDALRMLAGDDGLVHMMLTDVVMPGMRGRDLAIGLAGDEGAVHLRLHPTMPSCDTGCLMKARTS